MWKWGGHTRLCVHITLNVQLTTQHLRPTKENTCLRRAMDLPDTLEDHIPIWSAEICGRSETRDSIAVRIRIINHDVCCVVNLDLGCEVGVNLDMIVHVLGFDGEEQGTEPLEGAEISADPEEVDFAETGLLLWVVHSVPDRLQDGGERSNPDTSTAEKSDLKLEYIF